MYNNYKYDGHSAPPEWEFKKKKKNNNNFNDMLEDYKKDSKEKIRESVKQHTKSEQNDKKTENAKRRKIAINKKQKAST